MKANIDLVTSTPALPTLEDIERRRRELLALRPAREPQTPDLVPHHRDMPDAALFPQENSWPQLPEPALYGLAGKIVRALEPDSEADPAALLLQFLAAFGNLLGPAPHAIAAGSVRHGLNLFVILVGQSSKARKGTSWRQLSHLLAELDAPWFTGRITNGRLSADGLIRAVRDQQPPTDRRLLVLAEEFASILPALSRNRGHLGPVLLSAWDHGDLHSLDRHHPLQATGAHITLIGHITRFALAPFLQGSIAHNGFANRCLWACVRRSQSLPDGHHSSTGGLAPAAAELRRVLAFASSARYPFERSPAAQKRWEDVYFELSQGGYGLHGAATSRAEAQVLRLSAIYAALDGTNIIEETHLDAALAVWDYCSAAAALLFTLTPEDRVAATISEAIALSPSGLSRDDIRKLFSGHVNSATIDAALAQLAAHGSISSVSAPTAGRPRTTWGINPNSESASDQEVALQY